MNHIEPYNFKSYVFTFDTSEIINVLKPIVNESGYLITIFNIYTILAAYLADYINDEISSEVRSAIDHMIELYTDQSIDVHNDDQMVYRLYEFYNEIVQVMDEVIFSLDHPLGNIREIMQEQMGKRLSADKYHHLSFYPENSTPNQITLLYTDDGSD